MSYAVKEMFLTLQGEGMQAGRRAVFVRFAGCNLWSGREADRADAECRFCDTHFVGTDGDGGGRFADADALAEQALALWRSDPVLPGASQGPEPEGMGPVALDAGPRRGGTDALVVLTGGEPTLQVDAALTEALKARGFATAIETNGTRPVADGVDWICVSPKAGTAIAQRRGDELKVVWPQPGLDMAVMEGWAFRHRLVQPMDGPEAEASLAATIAFVMANPRWRLSLQNHKAIGLR